MKKQNEILARNGKYEKGPGKKKKELIIVR